MDLQHRPAHDHWRVPATGNRTSRKGCCPIYPFLGSVAVVFVVLFVWHALRSRGAPGGHPEPNVYDIRREGTNLVLDYTLSDMSSLQVAPSLSGPWQVVTNATYPYVVPQPLAPMQFFRGVFTNVPCTNGCSG